MARVPHETSRRPLYAGLEAGGTKCVCAIGTGPDDIRVRTQFATTTPAETMAHAVAFFEAYRSGLMALGIASFGPLDPRPDSASFGYITSTPKPGWAHTDLAGRLSRALGLPVAFDTDVNAAALAEQHWGKPADTLPADHPAWSLAARYLALGLVTFICTLVPQRIIMGGGVMHQEHLFPRLRHEVRQLLNGYIQVSELHDQLDDYIVPPVLGDRAGVLGALALAHTVRSQ